jgi:hypothetical protein
LHQPAREPEQVKGKIMTNTYYAQQWNDETVNQAVDQRFHPLPAAGPMAPATAPISGIRHIDQGRFWVGAVLTSTVAALGGVLGLVVAQDLLRIPLTQSPFGFRPVHIASYGLIAGVVAMLAATVYAALLAFAPRPTVYFGALGGMLTALAVLLPFTVPAAIGGQIAVAAINLTIGTLILSLIPVAASNSTAQR